MWSSAVDEAMEKANMELRGATLEASGDESNLLIL